MDNAPKPTVLIVEDHDLDRDLFRRMVEWKGYRVVEAVNGHEALEKAKSERPALILMDIDMPVIDGISAALLIREIDGLSTVPIVAISGHTHGDKKSLALAVGVNEYMHKPIGPDRMFLILSRYLGDG